MFGIVYFLTEMFLVIFLLILIIIELFGIITLAFITKFVKSHYSNLMTYNSY